MTEKTRVVFGFYDWLILAVIMIICFTMGLSCGKFNSDDKGLTKGIAALQERVTYLESACYANHHAPAPDRYPSLIARIQEIEGDLIVKGILIDSLLERGRAPAPSMITLSLEDWLKVCDESDHANGVFWEYKETKR